MEEKKPFCGTQSAAAAIAAFIWLPIHIVVLPLVMDVLIDRGLLDVLGANFWLYAAGAAYMLVTQFTCLRRDFDPLCDRPLRIVLEIIANYCLLQVLSIALQLVLAQFMTLDNQNDDVVLELLDSNNGITTAMLVFLAPLVEEPIFRGSIFSLLGKKSRAAAYLVSIALFSLYHVWSYAIYDPTYLVYLVFYIPASWILCRTYERTGSLWACIFLHMLVNGLSLAGY